MERKTMGEETAFSGFIEVHRVNILKVYNIVV